MVLPLTTKKFIRGIGSRRKGWYAVPPHFYITSTCVDRAGSFPLYPTSALYVMVRLLSGFPPVQRLGILPLSFEVSCRRIIAVALRSGKMIVEMRIVCDVPWNRSSSSVLPVKITRFHTMTIYFLHNLNKLRLG